MRVNNIYKVFIALLVTSALVGARMMSSGPPQGVSGAPNEGLCTQCHGGTANTGAAQITITVGEGLTNYVPGETYPITVQISESAINRFGFEMTALSSENTGAGQFASINSSTTVSAGNGQFSGRSYVTHSSQGTSGTNNQRTWTFNWKAPANDVGPVTFYLAAISANNNGNTNGDKVYTRTTVLTPFVQPSNITLVSAALAGLCQQRCVVNFDTQGNFGGNNTFAVRLFGENLPNPILLNTLQGSSTSIIAQFPTETLAAGTYMVQVVSTNPVVESQPFPLNYIPSQAELNGLPANICTNAPEVVLSGSPAGGVFAGPGVSGNIFMASAAGPGTHTIQYQITEGECLLIDVDTITVTAEPSATFLNLQAQYCVTNSPFALEANPAGGMFMGPGIINGILFNPGMLSPGTYEIMYHGELNGCAYQTSQTVTIAAPPNAQILNLPEQVCINHPPITLQATPVGGAFTGPFVSGNLFVPQIPGNNTITYSGVAGGCTYQTSSTITVNPLPQASISTQPASCQSCPDGKANIAIDEAGIPPYHITVTPPFGVPPYWTDSLLALEDLLPGTYVATVSSIATGCTRDFSFVIESLASCGIPTSLMVTNIQAGTVLLQWGTVPGAISYTLRYRKVGGTTWQTLNVNTNNRVLTGLSTEALYEWTVRAVCINVGAGSYAAIQSFTAGQAAPPCQRPAAISATEVTTNSATLFWSTSMGAIGYELSYRRTLGGSWATLETPNNSYTLTDLTPNTLYTVRVRARCSDVYLTPYTPTLTFQTGTGRLWAAGGEPVYGNIAGLSLYPNPNKGYFQLNLESEQAQTLTAQLFDLQGKLVYAQPYYLVEGYNQLSIMPNVSAGLYLLRIGAYTERVIIE